MTTRPCLRSWITDPEATSPCVASVQMKGLALPIKLQDHEVLPCGRVGLPQGLYRSAFALTIDHNRYLIYSAMAGFAKRRVLESHTGAVPRACHDVCTLSSG